MHSEQFRNRIEDRSHVEDVAFDSHLPAGQHHKLCLSRTGRTHHKGVRSGEDVPKEQSPVVVADAESVLVDGRGGVFLLG